MSKIKVVVVVKGGAVQEVLSDDPGAVDVTVFDEDNLEEEMDSTEREKEYGELTKGLTPIPF